MKYISSEKLLQEYFNDERHQINLYVANFKVINEELRRCCNTKKRITRRIAISSITKDDHLFQKSLKTYLTLEIGLNICLQI